MVSCLTFWEALQSVTFGSKIHREGWGSAFVSLAPGKTIHADQVWSNHAREFANRQTVAEGFVEVLPSLTLKTADGRLQMGWTPSTGDLFAKDWVAEE